MIAARRPKIAICSRGDYRFFGDSRRLGLAELSQGNRRLRLSVLFTAAFAGLASLAYFVFWLEVLDELHLS